MKRYAIIVAGGSGSRMGSDIPKQFLLLQGKPILMHTLERFTKADPKPDIILVLPEIQIPYWEELCQHYSFAIKHRTVSGGHSRFMSVKNGLSAIENKHGLVAIHDGVRPLTNPLIIEKSYSEAQIHQSAIVSVPLKDSIRFSDDKGNHALDRSKHRLIQTPQTFLLEALWPAFAQKESDLFTDDASVFEHAGHQIHLIDGDYENIKITTPEDMVLGETLLQRQIERSNTLR